MIICGIKVTHDAAIALVDNGKLIFSYEMEKIDNRSRYSAFDLTWSEIEDILHDYGYSTSSVNSWVIDGWHSGYSKGIKLEGYESAELRFNDYNPLLNNKSVLDVKFFELKNGLPSYNSYHHLSGHIVGAYCSSPFAKEQIGSFVLAWDGAVGPQLYYFNIQKKEFEMIGIVHYFYGDGYAEFGNRFDPFKKFDKNDLSVPGKMMAYIAKGKILSEFLDKLHQFYIEEINLLPSGGINESTYLRLTKRLLQKAYDYGMDQDFLGDDLMATLHQFILEILLQGLQREISKMPSSYKRNLCYSGGCALNIKWNSAIRGSGLFTNFWIPPFPNDSGSAIGVACCEMLETGNNVSLDWNVYKGPKLKKTEKAFFSWEKMPCTISQLASILHHSNEPVVFLSGRAELGPRALGNRSILAAASSPKMKDILNDVKDRESYRPVAPICLEEYASTIFEPGGADPFMLFDHQIKPSWLPLIPAVSHIDGSARLQTVNEFDNPEIFLLLTEYHRLSGSPLLCNTSANLNGRGFFPDVASAIRWGRANFVWANGIIWCRTAPPPFFQY